MFGLARKWKSRGMETKVGFKNKTKETFLERKPYRVAWRGKIHLYLYILKKQTKNMFLYSTVDQHCHLMDRRLNKPKCVQRISHGNTTIIITLLLLKKPRYFFQSLLEFDFSKTQPKGLTSLAILFINT